MNAKEILADPKRDENEEDDFSQEYDEEEEYEDADSSGEEDEEPDGFKVNSDYYEENFWAADGSKSKPEDMNGFTFKSTHQTWILNADRVHKLLNVKDRSLKIPVSETENVRFKCVKTDTQNQATILLVQHPGVGKGEISVKWWNKSRTTRRSRSKNKGCTLHVARVTESFPEHILAVRKALSFQKSK